MYVSNSNCYNVLIVNRLSKGRPGNEGIKNRVWLSGGRPGSDGKKNNSGMARHYYSYIGLYAPSGIYPAD